MMVMRRLTGILCLLLLTGLVHASTGFADNGMDREGDLSRVRKKIEALRAWQLTEELELDEATSSKLFPAMKRADEARWKIERNNRDLVKEMARILERRRPDEKRINRILNELLANRRDLIRAEERHLERVRQILSPADTARYLIFQIKFQKNIRKKAAEAIRDGRLLQDPSSRTSRDGYSTGDSDRGSSDGSGSGGAGSDGGKGSSDGGGDRRR